MIGFNDLTDDILKKLTEITSTFIFIIKNDMTIIQSSENFQYNNFSAIDDFITHTHKSSFISNLDICIEEKSTLSFSTNFSYDSNDVEDIPHSFKIIMQYIQKDKIIIIAEPEPPLTHEDSKSYFSMVNDYSYISRKFQKLEYVLNKKNEYLKEKMQELEYYANYDVLTDIYNRKKIFEELNQEYNKYTRVGTTFSIVMIDIDDFKSVNDKYGHQSGDIILNEISQIFKEMCREYDTVGRFGGEEFLIILPSSDISSAISFTNRILKTVTKKELAVKNGEKVHISFSAGVANASECTSMDDLIAKADMRLYKAKKNGKDQVQ